MILNKASLSTISPIKESAQLVTERISDIRGRETLEISSEIFGKPWAILGYLRICSGLRRKSYG